MLEGGIKSLKPIEEALEARAGQRETQFPALCPHTRWHSQAIRAVPQLPTCTPGEPSPSRHQRCHEKLSGCFPSGDVAQGQVAGCPPLTLPKATTIRFTKELVL